MSSNHVFPGSSVLKNPLASAGDLGSIPGLGRSHMPQSYQARVPQLFSLCLHVLSRFSLTLCNPMDRSLPGSSVLGILQARILKWVAMPSSRGSAQPRDQTGISYVSCIGRQVLYHFTTWETPLSLCSGATTEPTHHSY